MEGRGNDRKGAPVPEPALEPAHEGDAAAAARAAREAVEALLDRRAHAGALLQVELRPAAPRRHPLSGERIRPATIAVLWQNEIPLAVLVHDVVAVSLTARRTVR